MKLDPLSLRLFVAVMEDGAIVEQGTHAELLEAKGAYYRLYQSQFAAAIED